MTTEQRIQKLPPEQRNNALLNSLDEMIETSADYGICPFVFRVMKDMVSEIIAENDALRAELKGRAE